MIDYETFDRAVTNGDELQLSRISAELLPKMTSYLQAVAGAAPHFAEEAAHNTFIQVCKQFREGTPHIQDDFISYLLVSARNNYFRLLKTENKYETLEEEEFQELLVNPEDQIENLIEEDYKKIIRSCIKQLNRRPRLFLLYVMKYPHYTPADVSKAFEMTEGSVRSTKTKLMRWLQNCFEQQQKK